MWKDILKQPITVGSTKIGLKPLPDDDECNRKLEAIANDVKSRTPVGESWPIAGGIHSQNDKYSMVINVRKSKPISEEVACIILEHIDDSFFSRFIDDMNIIVRKIQKPQLSLREIYISNISSSGPILNIFETYSDQIENEDGATIWTGAKVPVIKW